MESDMKAMCTRTRYGGIYLSWFQPYTQRCNTTKRNPKQKNTEIPSASSIQKYFRLDDSSLPATDLPKTNQNLAARRHAIIPKTTPAFPDSKFHTRPTSEPKPTVNNAQMTILLLQYGSRCYFAMTLLLLQANRSPQSGCYQPSRIL